MPWFVLSALTLAHLTGQVIAADGWVTSATQVVLMPALAWALVDALPPGAVRSSRLARLVLLGLFFSWLGDTVPRVLDEDPGFLAMIGCFFLAQLAYVAAFLPLRDRAAVWRSPVSAAPYLLAFVALVLLCREGAGPLLVPVMIYGLAMMLMAMLAGGLPRPGTLGGALFFASDALIALGAFADVELPASNGIWVMLTYVLGQALLVLGVVAAHHRPAAPTVRRTER